MANCENNINIPQKKIPISVDEMKKNRRKIFDALMNSGLPKMNAEYAAVVCGNIYGESGYNQYNVNPSSGAYGICQWLWHTRVDGLKKYAKECNKPISDIDLQINYMIKELKEGTTWAELIKLDGEDIINKGVSLFCNKFENPGVNQCRIDNPKRTRAAKKALEAHNTGNDNVSLE